MRRHASFALAVLLAALASARSAAAAPPDAPDPQEREPDVTIALVSGVATAMLPIALGAIHTSSEPVKDYGARNVGFAVAGVGPALAPIVAHAVLGEWKRAAAFGAVPVASEIAISAFLQAYPAGVFNGTVGSRTTFGILYTADLLGAAVGLVDVMMAPERARERRASASRSRGIGLTLVPSVGPGHAGIVLGGAL